MEDLTWELMQGHLDDSGAYDVMSSRDSAPSEHALRAVGDSLGCRFPDEFIAHATNEYGGVYIAVNEEVWPRPKEGDVGPSWSFLYGLFTYNIADNIPDFMNLETNARQFQEETKHKIVPFMKIIGNADVYCFDQDGNVVRWDHELNEIAEWGLSFFDVLDFELGELSERKEQAIADDAGRRATASPSVGRPGTTDISTVRLGIGLGDIRFGASISEVEAYFGKPDSRDKFSKAENFTVGLYWDSDVSCWFDSDDGYRLGSIQVAHTMATLESFTLIGQSRAHVLETIRPLFGEPELEDMSSVEMPDYWLATFDSQSLGLWFTEDLLTAIMWNHLTEKDDETVIWPT